LLSNHNMTFHIFTSVDLTDIQRLQSISAGSSLLLRIQCRTAMNQTCRYLKSYNCCMMHLWTAAWKLWIKIQTSVSWIRGQRCLCCLLVVCSSSLSSRRWSWSLWDGTTSLNLRLHLCSQDLWQQVTTVTCHCCMLATDSCLVWRSVIKLSSAWARLCVCICVFVCVVEW